MGPWTHLRPPETCGPGAWLGELVCVVEHFILAIYLCILRRCMDKATSKNEEKHKMIHSSVACCGWSCCVWTPLMSCCSHTSCVSVIVIVRHTSVCHTVNEKVQIHLQNWKKNLLLSAASLGAAWKDRNDWFLSDPPLWQVVSSYLNCRESVRWFWDGHFRMEQIKMKTNLHIILYYIR